MKKSLINIFIFLVFSNIFFNQNNAMQNNLKEEQEDDTSLISDLFIIGKGVVSMGAAKFGIAGIDVLLRFFEIKNKLSKKDIKIFEGDLNKMSERDIENLVKRDFKGAGKECFLLIKDLFIFLGIPLGLYSLYSWLFN